MNSKLYRIYLFITKLKRRVQSRLSPSGRLIVIFTIMSVLFGLNTRQTMIYQLAALLLALLLLSFPFSFLLPPSVRIRRVLPKTCTSGDKLTYYLQIENTEKKPVAGLIFKERSGAGYPTLEEFTSNEEKGEQERNYFDRKLRYYRWLWLLKYRKGVHFEPFRLPNLIPRERSQVEVSLLPIRRGYIQVDGYTTHRLDPLGLFKNEIFFSDAEKLLVLPKMYPVIQTDLVGTRKYHQGGLTSATNCGESGEFISFREYRPGDPVKHIDWKVTARIGNSIVRQYQDEYFSRFGILLDTFADQDNIIFEDAVSVAASVLVQQDATRNIIDLLFACDQCISSVTMGPGQSDQHHMLEVLACIGLCRNQDFSRLTKLVMSYTEILSGLILVLVKIDKERKQLIDYLNSMKIPYRAILISDNIENQEMLLQEMGLHNVIVFDAKSDTKLIDLT